MQKRIITILAILLFGIQFQSFALTCPTSTPCNVTVTQDLYNNNDVILSWGTVSASQGYKIYYRKVGSSTFYSYSVSSLTTIAYMPIFLFEPGVAYNFAVSTILGGGSESPKQPAPSSFKPPITPSAITLIVEFNISSSTPTCPSTITLPAYSPFSEFVNYSGDFSATPTPPLAMVKSSYNSDILNWANFTRYDVRVKINGELTWLPTITRSQVLSSFTPLSYTPLTSGCISSSWPAARCSSSVTALTYNRLCQYLSNSVKEFVSSNYGSCPSALNYSINNYYINTIRSLRVNYSTCISDDPRYCGVVCKGAGSSSKTDETENQVNFETSIVEDQETINELELLFANTNGSFNLFQKQDMVTLSLGGNIDFNYAISVIDQTGRLIEKQTDIQSSSHTFDISNYSRGIYMVTLEQNGNRQTKKFIKY